jgi:hypothetical protein
VKPIAGPPTEHDADNVTTPPPTGNDAGEGMILQPLGNGGATGTMIDAGSESPLALEATTVNFDVSAIVVLTVRDVWFETPGPFQA